MDATQASKFDRRPAPEGARRTLSLRISVTDRCQLRCVHCMPIEGVPELPRGDILSFEEILRFVRALKSSFNLSKVHITGGEPLVRPDVSLLVGMLADEDIPDLALTTNGQRLGKLARDLKSVGLCRVNVSLPSLDERTYKKFTRGGDLKPVLSGIDQARSAGLDPVKLNAVVLRGYNDGEVTRLAAFAMERECRIRFLELMPIGCAQATFPDRFVSSAEVRRRLENSLRLTPLPYRAGRSSRDFLAEDRRGRSGIVGLISSESQPFCRGCARLRLTSAGEVVSCLARGDGAPVRDLLRSRSRNAAWTLGAVVAGQLDRKCVRESFITHRAMTAVGG